MAQGPSVERLGAEGLVEVVAVAGEESLLEGTPRPPS